MAQGRSLFKEILKNIIDSFSLRHFKYKLVGKDYLGTEYYEAPQNSNRKRPSRWFTPVEKDNFQQDIPPEWEAWLRYRRKYPPTEEEIQTNLAKMRQTIENAKKLEKPQAMSDEEIKNVEKPSFPIYDDLQFNPRNEKEKL